MLPPNTWQIVIKSRSQNLGITDNLAFIYNFKVHSEAILSLCNCVAIFVLPVFTFVQPTTSFWAKIREHVTCYRHQNLLENGYLKAKSPAAAKSWDLMGNMLVKGHRWETILLNQGCQTCVTLSPIRCTRSLMVWIQIHPSCGASSNSAGSPKLLFKPHCLNAFPYPDFSSWPHLFLPPPLTPPKFPDLPEARQAKCNSSRGFVLNQFVNSSKEEASLCFCTVVNTVELKHAWITT